MEKKTVNTLSRFTPSLTVHNDTGKALPLALLSVLKGALSRGRAVVPCFTADPVSTRAERTQRGALEVELYGDGSGLEVAFMGRLFVLGVEAKRGAVGLVCS